MNNIYTDIVTNINIKIWDLVWGETDYNVNDDITKKIMINVSNKVRYNIKTQSWNINDDIKRRLENE